ncbi:hypothetical protein ScPMuIL_007198 [Solemya velum]
MTDTRDFFCKLCERVAGFTAAFTAACNKKIEKSEYAEYGLGREMYYDLTRVMVGEISMDKPDGPLAKLSTWIQERETTTQKVADLSDTFYRALTIQQRHESEVLRAQEQYYRLNKAIEEMESMENNTPQLIPEAQWNKNVAKQERKISSRVSKVESAKENHQESLDEEFANRPLFVKAVLSGKEWLEDIEEERYCVLKTATLSFVDALRSEFQEHLKHDYSGGSSKLSKTPKRTGNKLVVERSGFGAKAVATELMLPHNCVDTINGRDTDTDQFSFESLVLPDKRNHISDCSVFVGHKRTKANRDIDYFNNAQSENGDTNDIPIIPDSYIPIFGGECKIRSEGDASGVSQGKVIALVLYTATSKGHLTLKTVVIDLVDLEGQIRNLSTVRSREYASELVSGRETYILIRVEKQEDGPHQYVSLLNNLEDSNPDLMGKLNSMSARPPTRGKSRGKGKNAKQTKGRGESPSKRPISGDKRKQNK